MAATTGPAEPVTPAATPYAGLATRAVALGLDTVVVQGTLLIVAALLDLVGSLVGGVHLGPVARVVVAGGWIVFTAGYFVVGWSVAGETVGMRVMHLRVVTADDGPPGVLRSLVRVVALAACIIPAFAGFLPVLVDSRRRGAHDMVAGTTVRYT